MVELRGAGSLGLSRVDRARHRRMQQSVLSGVREVLRRDVDHLGDLVPVCVAASMTANHVLGDELVVARVVTHDVDLPAQELRRHLGVEPPPVQVVARVGVTGGPPEVGPVSQPMRPVRKPPELVEPIDGAVLSSQPVDEPIEHRVVAGHPCPGFVVHLEADDRRVLRVTLENEPRDSFRVRAVGRVGDVHVLSGAEWLRPAVDSTPHHVRVLAGEPGWDGVRRRDEHDLNAGVMQTVQHRLQPVQVELTLARLTESPDGVAEPCIGDAGVPHHPNVVGEPVEWLVLVIVRNSEQHGAPSTPEMASRAPLLRHLRRSSAAMPGRWPRSEAD